VTQPPHTPLPLHTLPPPHTPWSHQWHPPFASRDGVLSLGGRLATDWVASAGSTPLFVYERAAIAARLQALRTALPARVRVHYAIKANPMPALLGWLAGQVDGFDVASAGELAKALHAGMSARHISMAGPAKSAADHEAALKAGALIYLESAREAEKLGALAHSLGVVARVGVRINPDFELKGSGMRMGGGAKPFGVDVAQVPALMAKLQHPPFNLEALHLYAGSQALDAAAIALCQRQALACALDLMAKTGVRVAQVNIGGGFGVPYTAQDTPLALPQVGDALSDALDAHANALEGVEIVVELGRYIVAEAGVYLTRIVERKESHGVVFLLVDGGLHHYLAASGNFGQVVRRNYPLAIANRYGEAASSVAHVVGCLCTPLDRLGDKVALPPAQEGDLVAVFLAGAYGLSASPTAFLSQPYPQEMLV
jgi:diaminopimelate decarboxylase